MAAMSKRQQARNERELHDLLRVPGNSQCADCGAKNPGWASWSLGIFVCMRCASLHRKLGTHISKVKSLSMDTWTSDQVENMKRNGNTAVNKTYNPKNKKPDMPLDADEVDSAMERFIRKKYQDRSLSEGRPEAPARTQVSPVARVASPDNSPPPPLPPKKGRFFGFGLRASSSAYPLSKHDKKNLPPQPRVDSAFRISGDNFDSVTRMADAKVELSEVELQSKLARLRDMGFTDADRNTSLLRRLNGNLERTVAALVQLGPSANALPTKVIPQQTDSSRTIDATATGSSRAVRSPTISNNPFDQLDKPGDQTVGLSFGPTAQATGQQQSDAPFSSNNPFDQLARNRTDTGLEQQFQSIQISQPLFPHSTGGYPRPQPPLQDQRLQYSMTPPVPNIAQQYYTASPPSSATTSNPFFQNQQPQQPSNNPYASQAYSQSSSSLGATNPFLAVQTNPFNQISQPSQPQPTSPSAPGYNPFGLPPSQSPQQAASQLTNGQSFTQNQHIQNPFGGGSDQRPMIQTQVPNPFEQQTQQPQFPVYPQPQSQPSQPQFSYGQSQMNHQSQQNASSQYLPQQCQYPQYPPQPQFQQPQLQQPQYSQQRQPQQPQIAQQSLVPQQTGRYDKSSILALYNYPQAAPRPLASIPEPSDTSQNQLQQQQQTLSPAPGNDPFGGQNLAPAKRAATMPVTMYSAGGGGSRNPFMQNSPGSPGQGITQRHASRESVLVNNLESGRHSPDAFANLSARYMG